MGAEGIICIVLISSNGVGAGLAWTGIGLVCWICGCG